MPELHFQLLSYWHCGSGQGRGPHADATILRDRWGLPFIPGRTIKGLIRDAMGVLVRAGVLREDRVLDLLGSAREEIRDSEQTGAATLKRYLTNEGAMRFGDAVLTDWRSFIARGGDPDGALRAGMVTLLAQTKLAEAGVADPHTLRVTEAAVPMTLWAQVDGPTDDATWWEDLVRALPLVKALGVNRHRGLGRVAVTAVRSAGS